MRNQFVSFKIAFWLYQQGFNEASPAWRFGDGSGDVHHEWRTRAHGIYILTPTVLQAAEWFKEKHGLNIYATFDDADKWSGIVYNPTNKKAPIWLDAYNTNQTEAISVALDHAVSIVNGRKK